MRPRVELDGETLSRIFEWAVQDAAVAEAAGGRLGSLPAGAPDAEGGFRAFCRLPGADQLRCLERACGALEFEAKSGGAVALFGPGRRALATEAARELNERFGLSIPLE